MKSNIIIIGSSGHAKVIIDIVELAGKYNIVGLLDCCRPKGQQVSGYEVLGKEEVLPNLLKNLSVEGVIVAVGDNFGRSQVVEKVRSMCPDLAFVNAIHPGATIAPSVNIDEGTVIMSGVSINPDCSIGKFCVLNTNSSLDHDSVMKDFASLAPGVSTGGNCNIGQFSAICIGAIIKEKINIGEHTVIGAGSIVLSNIGNNVVAYGLPAKKIRPRKPGDKYL